MNKQTNLSEQIEEVFFRAILLIALITCAVSIVFDLLITTNLNYIVPVNILFILILLFGLFAFKRLRFHPLAFFSLTALDVIVFLRGIVYPEFYHITCAFLICIGFMSSLIGHGISGKILQGGVLTSFLAYLVSDFKQLPPTVLIRQALPYLMVYSAIAILTGLLKERYAKNRACLVKLVDVLKEKNSTINEQHLKLQASYKELSDLNQNLALIIKQKTNSIAEKNKQLAQIAYENSHCIRAPLARLLGLLHLIEIDPIGKDYYISKLDDEAIEMDERIRTLVRSIEKNLHE
jgi:signal transduction histidine kinase